MKSLARLLGGSPRRNIVGLMSGTSADGVDAALLEIETAGGAAGGKLAWELVDFVSIPFGAAVRAEILAVQEACPHLLERLTRLHFVLGGLYAEAVEVLARDAGCPLHEIDLVACHGQTVCHFPAIPSEPGPRGEALVGSEAWGRPGPDGTRWISPATLQIGEPAVIAERTGIAVMRNFRSRDVAAGGTGAPLVPLVDHLLFGDPNRSRLALNVGGIANFTALPAGGSRSDLIAFDTGPGNMILDAAVELLSEGARHMDEGGAMARRGTPDAELVDRLLQDPFFAKDPPRAAGREQFGVEYTRSFLDEAAARQLSEASTLATATLFTAAAVHDAYRRFVLPRFPVEEIIVSGGGAHNVALLESLAKVFGGVPVVTSDYYGLDVDAKEAAAFALLGYLGLQGEAGNLPGVTGARHPVILGDLTPGGAR